MQPNRQIEKNRTNPMSASRHQMETDFAIRDLLLTKQQQPFVTQCRQSSPVHQKTRLLVRIVCLNYHLFAFACLLVAIAFPSYAQTCGNAKPSRIAHSMYRYIRYHIALVNEEPVFQANCVRCLANNLQRCATISFLSGWFSISEVRS